MAWFVWLFACAVKSVECGPQACAEVCAAQQEPRAEGLAGASPFEASLLEPMLAQLRAGVQPWGEEGIGICQGTRSCDAFLGLSPGELAPGDYVLRADLRVPEVGARGTWTVTFATECASAGGAPERYTRTYDVLSPRSERPYQLKSLRRITSPSGAGPTSCTWTLTAPHPDGDKVYQGAWSTP